MPGYMQRLKELGKNLGRIETALDTTLSPLLAASSVIDAEMTGVWHKTVMGVTAYDAFTGQEHRMMEGTTIPAYLISELGQVNGSIASLALGLALYAGVSFGMYKLSDRIMKAAFRSSGAGAAGNEPSIAKKAPVYVFLAGATAVRVASGILSWPC